MINRTHLDEFIAQALADRRGCKWEWTSSYHVSSRTWQPRSAHVPPPPPGEPDPGQPLPDRGRAVACLDAGDIVAEHDPVLSIEENASTDEWSRVERVERRVVANRVVVHFEDGSRAAGYPEQTVVRAVAL